MGYIDRTLRLSESQAVTADADSTYYVDTELASPKWNRGMPAAVIINVEAVTTAGTGMVVTVVHKISEPTIDDANICSATFLAAELAAGKQLVIPLPFGKDLLRYLRIYYNITAGTESYTLSAYFTPMLAPV